LEPCSKYWFFPPNEALIEGTKRIEKRDEGKSRKLVED